MDRFLYNRYSDYLKKKYGQKVYKLPINLDITCPNRDGTIGTEGCYFCSDLGTGFESLENKYTVRQQLIKNMDYIGKRYGAKKFIAYFQNYTNTYMCFEDFKCYIIDAIQKDIVEIDISTRPDCLGEQHLEFLQSLKMQYNINFTIELGLQSSNDDTLKAINRGHSVKDYIDSVKLIKKYDFDLCTHLILNLPSDTSEDAIKSAKLMNEVQTEQVKLHSLYIAKGSVFEKLYNENKIVICSMEEYIERVILFLENLNPEITVQRLLGRVPEEQTIFCNWKTSWWKIQEQIEQKMISENRFQGKQYQKYI